LLNAQYVVGCSIRCVYSEDSSVGSWPGAAREVLKWLLSIRLPRSRKLRNC